MIILAVLALATVQAEGKLNCDDPKSQQEMNECSFAAYERADAALNRQWKPLFAKMEERDKVSDFGSDNGPTYVAALMASQRSWLKFRDANCVSESYFARGGSMEPMVLGNCLEQVTVARTKQLHDLLELFEL